MYKRELKFVRGGGGFVLLSREEVYISIPDYKIFFAICALA